jgi:hypothetical protein
MCSANDDPTTYDRKPGDVVNGVYTVVAPGESARRPGRPPRLSLYPSFILTAGWHYVHSTPPVPVVHDDPETWFSFGWLLMSLWYRDENADVYDAEMELTPLLDAAIPRWFRLCPECDTVTVIFSALDMFQHFNTVHNWSLHVIETWLRQAFEARIELPEEGDVIAEAFTIDAK